MIRQITTTVTFLPLLEVPWSFDLLIYTDKDLVVPEKWEESGPQFITTSEQVRLHSFTTSIHKVNSTLAYRIPSPTEGALRTRTGFSDVFPETKPAVVCGVFH